MSIQNELARLNDAKTSIATAIAEKGITVPDGTRISEMDALISQISGGTDTSDATALNTDIANGKTAYVNGEKITGTIGVASDGVLESGDAPLITIQPEVDPVTQYPASYTSDSDATYGSVTVLNFDNACHGVNNGTYATLNLTKGATFVTKTSRMYLIGFEFSNIANITDTHVDVSLSIRISSYNTSSVRVSIFNGDTIISDNASLSTSSTATTFTVDANTTIACKDLPNLKVRILAGTQSTSDPHLNLYGAEITAKNSGSSNIAISKTFDNDVLIRSGNEYGLKATVESFGNANASDVRSGKTFTSSYGLRIAGTAAVGSGGVVTSDATATADDILSGKTAYAGGKKIAGSIETATAPTPSISISSSGLITASVNNPKGYQESATTKTSTNQLSTKSAATIKPGTNNQTIASDIYLTGVQTIQGDANLIPANIKSGVSIFGVAGSYVGSSGGSTTYNCEAVHVTDITQNISFKTTAGTIKVWGYGLKSSGSYSNTMYAFCGDGYYTGSYMGKPGKTSATFSIGTDGTLTGVPSGLTGIDVIVTIGL